MDAYVPRKRKWAEKVPKIAASSTRLPLSEVVEQEESTDFKLALLASLHPALDDTTLLEALLAADGSVEQASASLAQPITMSTQKRAALAVGHQSSLSAYRIPSVDGKLARKPLVKKGQTLFLYSPEDIETYTPCSIVHNFLPVKQAEALLLQLLDEASTYQKLEFQLFDKVVWSPHTYSFYVNSLAEAEEQKSEYIYAGGRVEVGVCYKPHKVETDSCRTFDRALQRCSKPAP